MKTLKLILIGAIGLSVLIGTSSCASTKKLESGLSQSDDSMRSSAKRLSRKKEKLNKCEEMSLDISDDKIKAYASAIDFSKDFARQAAVLNARGELAAAVKVMVTNVFKAYRTSAGSNDKMSSDMNRTQTIDQLAQETMTNSTILCSERYVLSNGAYEYVVCVGVSLDLEEKVKEAISSEDKILKLQFDEQNFRNTYEKELEEYKEQNTDK